MDIKRYINTKMWSDTWFEELEVEEKLLWIYFLTNQHANLIGIYEIGLKRISNESGIEINRLQTVMERFQNSSKLFYNGKFLIIPNFLKHQTLANPNMVKSAKNLFENLPENVKNTLKSVGIADFEKLKQGLPNRLQTVTKPLPNRSVIEKEEEDEKEDEKEVYSPENFSQNFPPTDNGNLIDPDRIAAMNFQNGNPPAEQPTGEDQKKKVAPKKKSPPPEIPSLEEFMVFVKNWMIENGKDYQGKRAQLISKYQAWVDAGWKDGNNKRIKNWKLKIQNTEPFLKADYAKSQSITRQAVREPQPGKSFGSL